MKMPLSLQTETPTTSEAEPNPVAIRDQLRRLVTHTLFTNSKRYPVLLAYIVDQTLDGKADFLKERTIGVEAFGREPDYDVNLDPVVRTTAAEVRKRLALYYYSAEHSGELIIELPVGSYVPLFRGGDARVVGLTSESVVGSVGVLADGESDAEPREAEGAVARLSRLAARPAIWMTTALVLALLAGFGLGRVRPLQRPSNIERFWAPIVATTGQVTYCLGEPGRLSTPTGTTGSAAVTGATGAATPRPGIDGRLGMPDVVTLARSIAPLVPRNVRFRVVGMTEAGFGQLREAPFVLIGAFDNGWTLRVTQDLPFGFEPSATGGRIVDRKSGGKRSWSLVRGGPNQSLERDYAIVARFHDKVTGQPVIVLAGILGQGTQAAGEVVSSAAYLDAVIAQAPRNWDQLNLEAVIGTRVIGGHPGPPTVEAVVTW
jgi:hypothetical protein